MYDKAIDKFIRVKILGKNKANVYLVKDEVGVVGTVLEKELFRSRRNEK